MLKKILVATSIVFFTATVNSQTLINQGGYDSKTLVDTNSTSNSTSSVNTTNTSTSTSNSTST